MPKENKFTDHAIILNEKDNVATALKNMPKGIYTVIILGKKIMINIAEDIKAGFKVSISTIPKGEKVYKYGHIIGLAKFDIKPGEKVHIENMSSSV